MKVRAIRSFVSPVASAAPGDVFDLPKDVAELWLRAGLVVPEVADVETAVNRSAEVAVTRRGRR